MLFSRLTGLYTAGVNRVRLLWGRFRALTPWKQYAIGAILLVLVIGGMALARSSAPTESQESLRTVSLMTLGELSGGTSGDTVLGTIRSESEASILAESGGTVKSVRTSLGASVPAGFIIGELENASQSAAVLQAQGAYDATIAARSALSLPESKVAARDTYEKAYTTVDTVVETDIDTFFGAPSPYGPILLLNQTDYLAPASLSHRRADMDTMLANWRATFATDASADPLTLLTTAYTNTATVSTFLNDLAAEGNKSNSGMTSTQAAALAEARVSIDALLGTLSTARSTYRSGSTAATAGADASVKQALGALRAAQANLEKTLIRAPIAGTVNFLPIRVGDYVTQLMHVATVAQNGALEVVFYVSEDTRTLLTVGSKVTVENGYTGVITQIAPALDPVTKQIEVHVALTAPKDTLVNGESVRVTLPGVAPQATAGPVLVPLASVKLAADSRVLFTVGDDGRLVAIPVAIGDVRGDRIEIKTAVPADTRIVTDARGLSEGDRVNVATVP